MFESYDRGRGRTYTAPTRSGAKGMMSKLPRPTRTLRLLVEAGASALPHGERWEVERLSWRPSGTSTMRKTSH
jgi:hypothetical protein